jgi:carboxylesterase
MASIVPMDPEKTAPFQIGEGDRACLMLHGFTGSPWDVRPLGEVLARNGYFVSAIQLPGHGTTPEAMDGVGYRDWKAAAERALLQINGFRQVFIVGLSMGALLAVIAAAAHPDRVAGLALVAPAMRLRGLGPKLARWGAPLGLFRLRPYVSKASTDIDDPVQRQAAPLLSAFPSARLVDLWMLQDEAAQVAPQIRAPVLIAMADHDHVVSLKGGVQLARALTRSSRVQLIRIQKGFHIIPRDFGRQALADQVLSFFRGTGAEHAPQVSSGN